MEVQLPSEFLLF